VSKAILVADVTAPFLTLTLSRREAAVLHAVFGNTRGTDIGALRDDTMDDNPRFPLLHALSDSDLGAIAYDIFDNLDTAMETV
jgi:hypothetical protein